MSSDYANGFEPISATSKETTTPVLSIYIGKTVTGRLNKSAVEKWFDDVDTVQLLHNSTTDELGIRRDPHQSDDNALRLSETTGGRTLAVVSMVRDIGVNAESLSGTFKLPLRYDERAGLIIADLDPLVSADWDANPADRMLAQSRDARGNSEATRHDDTKGVEASSGPDSDGPMSSGKRYRKNSDDRQRVLDVLAENDGSMPQPEIPDALGRSYRHIAGIISDLDEEGHLRKHRLGRSNIVHLPGQAPDRLTDDTTNEDPQPDPIERAIDLTQVDMAQIRSVLPTNTGVSDVVESCQRNQSLLGVARELSISVDDARTLLDELGLLDRVVDGDGGDR